MNVEQFLALLHIYSYIMLDRLQLSFAFFRCFTTIQIEKQQTNLWVRALSYVFILFCNRLAFYIFILFFISLYDGAGTQYFRKIWFDSKSCMHANRDIFVFVCLFALFFRFCSIQRFYCVKRPKLVFWHWIPMLFFIIVRRSVRRRQWKFLSMFIFIFFVCRDYYTHSKHIKELYAVILGRRRLLPHKRQIPPEIRVRMETVPFNLRLDKIDI